MPKGEKNKLTERQRKDILELKGKAPAKFIANQYGVTFQMVYKIWKKDSTKINQIQPNADTLILKKILKPMIKKKVVVDLEEQEIKRIQELMSNGKI